MTKKQRERKIYIKHVKEIDDNVILQIFYGTTDTSVSIRVNTHYNKMIEQNPYIKKYLENRYKDGYISFGEVLYRIFHKIEVRPVCPICGGFVYWDRHGYHRFCSIECQKTEEGLHIMADNVKKTMQETYGYDNAAQIPEVREKMAQTNLIRWGFRYASQSPLVKEKAEQTNLIRWGFKHASQSPEVQEKMAQTNLIRWGVRNVSQSKEMKQKLSEILSSEKVQQKRYATLKKNGTAHSSKIEKQFLEFLVSIFGEDDVKTQYKSELYNYHCDFYIKSLDLYIEIQGTWFHGTHPFDENNIDDIKKLNELKENEAKKLQKQTKTDYTNVIKKWTISDVNKRNTAKNNNLNFLEIFSDKINICIEQFNEYIQNKFNIQLCQ